MNATLWIDQRDHFAMEHQEEWAEQKEQECTLNDLERDTEVVYRARIIRRQEDKLLADSKEAAAKDLPPEQRAAHAERQASAMPRKDGVSSTSMSTTLYPDWVLSRAGKRTSPDTPNHTGRLGRAPADASPWRRNWMPPLCSTPYSRARELRDHERCHTTARLRLPSRSLT